MLALAASLNIPVTAQVDEIIVTARKRAESINDIGGAVLAITGEQLQDFGVIDTSDLAALTPGFTFAETGAGVPVFTIRGVGFNDLSYGSASTVTVYVDEIGIPYPVMSQGALLDVAQVEILKGPQGTLFGRNTTGGLVNYIAAKPSDDPSFGASMSYSSYQTGELSFHGNIPLTDGLRSRIAFRTIQSGTGWQENAVNDETLGKKNKTALRASIDADLGEKLTALVQFNWWEDKSGTQAPQTIRLTPQNPTNATIIGLATPLVAANPAVDDNNIAAWTRGQDFQKDMSTTSINLRLEYPISDNVEIVSLTGYAKFEDKGSLFPRDGTQGISFTDANAAGFTNFLIPGVGFRPNILESEFPFLPALNFKNTGEIKTFSQEIRVVGSSGDLDWIVGGYYADDTNDTGTRQDIQAISNTTFVADLPFLNFATIDTIANQDTTNISGFANFTYAANDDLNVIVAARYSDVKTGFEGCTADTGLGDLGAFFTLAGIAVGGGFGAGECGTSITDGLDAAGNPNRIRHGLITDELNESSLAFKLGAEWNMSDDVLLYAAYDRGFKAGAFPNLAANLDIQYAPAVQEQLDAIEAGFKATLADGLLQLNGSAYYYDYKDKQLLGSLVAPPFGVLRRLVNAPKSTVLGGEFDFTWAPTDGLFFSGGASYVDSEIKNYTGPDQFGIDFDFSGSPFPYTAKFQTNALFNYEMPISGKMKGFIGGDANYSSKINADFVPAAGIDPDFVLPSRTIFNARVGIAAENDRWRLSVWSRNFTDEFSTTNVIKSGDNLIRFTGQPRMFGVTLDLDFE